jgi:hypothetical protein
MSDAPLVNTGVIVRRSGSGKRKDEAKRTIVVTGVARSGTSMVAAALRAAGLHMGDFVHSVVNEDAQMLEIVRSHDMGLLRSLIRERNLKHSIWGFKVPNLHAHLRYDSLDLFRNPHLVVVYRDPVAVAMRNSLSEHTEQLDGVLAASGAMQAMTRFAQQAGCPLLLLSYEKIVGFPPLLIDSLADFCGISLSPAQRAALLEQVKPNNPEYFAVASRRFLGRIDGSMDGALYGWCFEESRLTPVRLDVLADGRLLESFDADQYRADLASGGIGNGCHGFAIDLSHHKLPAGAVIRVKIAGRQLELENSGQALWAFPVHTSSG